MILKIDYLRIKSYSNQNKDLKMKKWSVYIEQINKIALSSNDDKRLQTFDKITTYPYGANAFEVCESEMLTKYKWLILMIIQTKIKQNIIQIGNIFYTIHSEY